MGKAILFLLVFAIQHLSAQESPEPMEADRPDQTETPAIVPAGMFQMENGFSFERVNSATKIVTTPTSLWKYGVNENFELRLITEFSSTDSLGTKISGISPVKVGFKVRLSEEKGMVPKVSFIVHLAIPSLASTDLKSSFYAPEFRFTMQHTLSDKFSFSYNLGAEWDGETPEAAFLYTVTTGMAITEKMGAFVELYGFAPEQQSADHRFDAGITYLISNNFMIDFSGGFGITENAPDYFISTGFSFRI